MTYRFYVYILASRSLQLYVGMTNNIRRRVVEHRDGRGSYTSRYNITRLVYYEETKFVYNAIAREKEIKDWNRKRKLALIKKRNPTLIDLAEKW